MAELKKNRATARGGKDADAEKPDVTEVLKLGTKLTGTLDGVNANGKEFHQATIADVVSRDESSFQLRVTINNDLEWIYDCSRDKGVYRISKATLSKAPVGFPTATGLVRITSSEVKVIKVKGKPVLRIAVTRPIGKTGVNAVYNLAPEAE